MDRPTPSSTKPVASSVARSAEVVFASNILERDQGQTTRLHEPTSIVSHTDPITGNDVVGAAGHPFIVDGILTAYFESDETRSAYLNAPFTRPVSKLQGKASGEDDRGG
jgi:hypothetical protein